MQLERQKVESQIELKRIEMQADIELERERAAAQLEIEQAKAMVAMQLKREEMQMSQAMMMRDQAAEGEAKDKEQAVHKNGFDSLASTVAQSTEAIIAALKTPRKMKTPDGRVYEMGQ
jgi:hypothetical protein